MYNFRLVYYSILLTLYLGIFEAANITNFKLRQLSLIFRHGDRMPKQLPDRFPNDPNMWDSFQPMGSGGLTNAGKLRMYQFGEHLRRRYVDFLGNRYEEKKLYGVSSNTTRTQMSLQLVQTALYPPKTNKDQRWHPTLDWQPIPLYYFEYKQNRLFDPDKCKQFVDELATVMNSTEVQRKIDKYRELLEEIRIATGKKSPINLDDASLLHNNLEIEEKLNLTMKPWMKDLLKDARLKGLRLLHYEIKSYTDLMRRFNSGFWLRQVTEDMLKVRNGDSGVDGKTLLYSGHDTNILNILQALGVWDSHFPEFSSAVIFELWSQDEKYFLRIFYYLGIPSEFKDYTEAICGSKDCPVDTFTELMKSKLILDDEKNCEITGEGYYS
ncbi:hypothetical protein QAD02_016475 [Eretmocerus hayati]|uniref:Uncharacterized protein n=1 Tax=Eretmocerus hayati TaxID=131215 RepID=A0ACC2PC86_9HYME|nr:hypothetical protein QAD02_016475 [Eretmocerus hayati]